MGIVSIGSKLLKTVVISAVSLDLAKLQLKNRKKNLIFPTLKIGVFAHFMKYLCKLVIA